MSYSTQKSMQNSCWKKHGPLSNTKKQKKATHYLQSSFFSCLKLKQNVRDYYQKKTLEEWPKAI